MTKRKTNWKIINQIRKEKVNKPRRGREVEPGIFIY